MMKFYRPLHCRHTTSNHEIIASNVEPWPHLLPNKQQKFSGESETP